VKTVVIKIPSHPILSHSKHLESAVKLRKWCHEHIKNDWCSFFLEATAHEENAQLDYKLVVFIGFKFEDSKEAMKFQLWAGNEHG